MVVIDLFVNAAMPTDWRYRRSHATNAGQEADNNEQAVEFACTDPAFILKQPWDWYNMRGTNPCYMAGGVWMHLAVVASSTCSLSITNVYMRALDNIIEWLYAAAGECQAACQTLLYLFLNQKGRKTLFQKREERNEVRTHNQTHKPELQPVGSAEERSTGMMYVANISFRC
uniref:Uncharacterized protein n=1 Tax=Leersia perrieri TaxID=77586 RepID=A0A0D9XZT4_9ORYZ